MKAAKRMMTLNNQSLMLLTKFALKAKRHLGQIKVMEMFNNKHYAYIALTNAAFTNDLELVDLTKKISFELKVGEDVISAIESFISNIQQFNNDKDHLHESKYFLIKLTNQLYGIAVNGETYRCAVDEMLLNINVNEKAKYINLARNFYRYCKVRGNSENQNVSHLNEKLIANKEIFIKRWENIDKEFLNDAESWPLTLYVESMRSRGLLEEETLICQKIAKVVLIELRNAEASNEKSYRHVIENIKTLFERDDLKNLFLIVSREFYFFWTGMTLGVINKKTNKSLENLN